MTDIYTLLLLSHFSRVRLCDPIDGSPPDSPVPGMLQTRTLEWVAISFSNRQGLGGFNKDSYGEELVGSSEFMAS